jgi:hypothetical protein
LARYPSIATPDTFVLLDLLLLPQPVKATPTTPTAASAKVSLRNFMLLPSLNHQKNEQNNATTGLWRISAEV